MLIRPATPADVPDLAALVNGAYRGTGATAGWTHEADLLDGQRTDAASLGEVMAGGATILVACQDGGGDPLGCVSVEPKRSDPGTWSIGMLTVAPTRQGSGLGSELLSAAETYAGKGGAARLEMTVISVRASLIAFYARRGFLPTARTAPFPYGDERFGRPRRPDLEFVVLSKPVGAGPGLSPE